MHLLKIHLILAGLSLASLSHAEAAPSDHQLTVMSYNILHGVNLQTDDALTSQAAAIKQFAPDFVGLQEVDNKCSRSGSVDQMKTLAGLTGLYPAFAPHFDFQGGQYGLGLLSKYPLSDIRNNRVTLINKGTTETRALLSATATLDDATTLVVATVHMGLNQESRIIQAREIISQLNYGSTPVILTGDFNAEPGTQEIEILQTRFQNTGSLTTPTYPVGKPVKTIDYIMIAPVGSAEVLDYEVADVPHSDHYPIIAKMELTIPSPACD